MSHFREKLRFWFVPEKGRPAKNLLFAFIATAAATAPDLVMNYAPARTLFPNRCSPYMFSALCFFCLSARTGSCILLSPLWF